MRSSLFSYSNLELCYLPSETFKLHELPKNSIAIDGIVEGTELDLENGRYSFDHHSKKIPRHAQNSSTKQIYDALMLGWKPPTRNKKIWVYFSDIDLDCMMSIYLLSLTKDGLTKRIKDWVDVINSVDVFGPAYKFNDDRSERIKDFLYYRVLRKHKGKNASSIISSILDKIDSYYIQKKGIHYSRHNKNIKNLVILEKSNFVHPEFPNTDQGLTLMCIMSEFPVFEYAYGQGADIVIGVRNKGSNYKYSIAIKHDFINYKIEYLLEKISERESGWGGGSTIIGSPNEGSSISPSEIISLVKQGKWNHTKEYEESTNKI